MMMQLTDKTTLTTNESYKILYFILIVEMTGFFVSSTFSSNQHPRLVKVIVLINQADRKPKIVNFMFYLNNSKFCFVYLGFKLF